MYVLLYRKWHECANVTVHWMTHYAVRSVTRPTTWHITVSPPTPHDPTDRQVTIWVKPPSLWRLQKQTFSISQLKLVWSSRPIFPPTVRTNPEAFLTILHTNESSLTLLRQARKWQFAWKWTLCFSKLVLCKIREKIIYICYILYMVSIVFVKRS